METIKFGTDGWRAVIADGYTFANLERVAQAYADYLKLQTEHNPFVVVGYDRRFMSGQFAQRAAEIMSGNGFEVALFPSDVPTPVVSWAVRDNRARGGIVITASHNPAVFNGFKIKAPWGGSAAAETTAQVEILVDKTVPQRAAFDRLAHAGALSDSIASYCRQLENYVDLERICSLTGSVVIDSMHGTGGEWTESFLRGGALHAETIRAFRDPLFGGVAPEPIDRNLGPLKARVKEIGALLGVATDGDADRLGAVNELGETMTMHEVVPLLLLHLARVRGWSGGVVRTFSQSVLTKRIGEAHGLKVFDTAIGFKYIADLFLREDILIGAEESGGIGLKNHLPERDGILNSLVLMEAVVMSGQTPSEMVKAMHREFGEFYFGRLDQHCEVQQGKDLAAQLAENSPSQLAGHSVTNVETTDGTKLSFADESWLLFRQSGTEPVLRIYSEATSKAKVQELLTAGTALVSS
jgi:phosphomannomutase